MNEENSTMNDEKTVETQDNNIERFYVELFSIFTSIVHY